MSELQVIESALDQAARRRRRARGLRGLWRGLFVGALISLLLVAVYHLLPLPLWTLVAAPLFPLPCLSAGLLIGGWRKPDRAQVARWVDGQQQLKERLSTALEVAVQPGADSWRDLVLADAAEQARGVDPRRLVTLRLPKAARWSLLILALTFGLGFVPEYRSKRFLQKQTDQQNIKAAGRQLADLVRRELDKRPPALEPTQKSLESVAELGDQLAKKTLTRNEALKDLASVADKLKEQLNELGKDPAFKKLEQAARAATGSESQTAAGIQKQMEALQKQLGAPAGNPEAIEKLKKDLEKLQAAAKGMADKHSAATEAERQQLSEALSALSRQSQEMGLQLPQLDDAIKALAVNQTDLVLKDLQASVTDLEKMRDMAKSLQQLQQQSEKLGKDLAEQLKNGQPEQAEETLRKMIEQLKSANLSQEQLDKIMQEVAKAIPPAANYGKVAQHLKEGDQQIRSGDKSRAAQSLAKAADELNQLMQQMGDAKEMMAALDAMNQASMRISTGQGWRACNQPGFNPNGSQGGGGVGTWAGEGRQWNGEFNDHWDNSGVVRPDMAPHGPTERPDDLSNALKPTKVKGQFSPGGQMPSITLKGISIKGQSTVGYEDAAAAAQSDAQSALSQEKVPRAYRGAVKDYFDDLKK